MCKEQDEIPPSTSNTSSKPDPINSSPETPINSNKEEITVEAEPEPKPKAEQEKAEPEKPKPEKPKPEDRDFRAEALSELQAKAEVYSEYTESYSGLSYSASS